VNSEVAYAVDVCPTDAFREGSNFLVIDPDDCIDCTLCVLECPVEAIFAEHDVPPDQRAFTPLNAELAKIWKPIIAMKSAPPDADKWAKIRAQIALCLRASGLNPSTGAKKHCVTGTAQLIFLLIRVSLVSLFACPGEASPDSIAV
jgi:ferredoxin